MSASTEAGFTAGLEVAGVRLQDFRRVLDQRIGDRAERARS